MIQIPNEPGKYAGEGLRIIVEKDRILIDTGGMGVQEVQPVKRIEAKSSKPELNDRIASSGNKAMRFINDMLMGEQR